MGWPLMRCALLETGHELLLLVDRQLHQTVSLSTEGRHADLAEIWPRGPPEIRIRQLLPTTSIAAA